MNKILTIIVVVIAMSCFGQKINVYGFSQNTNNYTEYLGCLSCGKYDSHSVWNPYSAYGSRYNNYCIWNEYGTYGSVYSQYSWQCITAKYPPIVVDENGGYYGVLTYKILMSLKPD